MLPLARRTGAGAQCELPNTNGTKSDEDTLSKKHATPVSNH
jgi:hypothetical protein